MTRVSKLPYLVLFCVACTLVARLYGQTPVLSEDQKIVAPDGASTDAFGFSVSMSGDVAVSGAYLSDTAGGSQAGSAHVYRFDGSNWAHEQKLTASDGASFDFFGRSVSVSGDVVIVGALQDNTTVGLDRGSAYVFRFDGLSWVEEQHLIAMDGQIDDDFSYSVCVSGDVAVIGAPRDDTPVGVNAGSIYVYRFDGSGWTMEQKIVGSGGTTGHRFGRSVSVRGNSIVVGAAGSAYVFRFDGTSWSEELQLNEPGAGAFGVSVSHSGGVAVVGASLDVTTMGVNSGSAYVYRYDGTTWVEEQVLSASDGDPFDGFGNSVSISGERLVVGAYFDDLPGGLVAAGSAYMYRFDGSNWIEEQSLIASDGGSQDRFGASVSLSCNTSIIGAASNDHAAGVDAGSAYMHVLGPGTDCTAFLRADCNQDQGIDIADPIMVLSILFSGVQAPSCDDACDTNDDGALDIGDPIFSLAWLFSSGSAPTEPFFACGPDPTTDALTCGSFAGCP